LKTLLTAIEVVKIINSLKNSNSCGIDNISNALLKKIAFNISDVLAYLFNFSIFSGIFPNDLKSAVVIPLFKKGERDKKQNYRPISLLPTIAKVSEKAVKKRMLEYLVKISFLSPKQFGFKEGTSTEDALLDFLSYINKGLDDKMICASFFVDITKAFDMVNHEILLQKLYSLGFRGFILNWFSSYLKNRMQRVKIETTLSDPATINLGVPQGSVLGPILFLVYVNSIFIQNFRGKLTAFADDIAISYTSPNNFSLVCDINHDSEVLRKWFANHKLRISSKTKIMLFSLSSQDPPDFEFFYHDQCCKRFNLSSPDPISHRSQSPCNENCFKIEVVKSFKYLGITLDSKLNWHEHTNSLKLYFRSLTRKFYQLSKICSTNVLKMCYFGLFHSRLQYGISCWGGTHNNKIKPILVLQKCIIKKIAGVDRMQHSFPLFSSFKILPVRHLYYFTILKQFHKTYVSTSFRSQENYRLRNAYNVAVLSFRSTYYRNCYSIVSCRLFNKVPIHIKTTINNNSFLKKIKSWLFSFNLDDIENLLNVLV